MQIDWWTLALQTVNFLIVVWLLSRFLYRPIRRVIEEREAADRKASEAAEEKVEAAEKMRREYEARRAELAEAQRRKEAKLHAEMERERDALLEAARTEATKLVDEARERIGREREDALDDLGEQIAALAGDLARKALGEGGALSGKALLERVTTHLDRLPEGDLADLRNDLAGGANGLALVTATPMPEPQRQAWRTAMATRLGDDAPIGFDTDPAILGGVELRFPHAVISFSVAERLQRAAQEMKAGDDGA